VPVRIPKGLSRAVRQPTTRDPNRLIGRCRRPLGPLMASVPYREKCVLARLSHRLSTTAGDAQHPAAFSQIGVLDVLSSTPPRPSDRKRRWNQHLTGLVTKPGEICGLGYGIVFYGRRPSRSLGRPSRRVSNTDGAGHVTRW